MIIEVEIPMEKKDPLLMGYLFQLLKELETRLDKIKRVVVRWEPPFHKGDPDIICSFFTEADSIQVNYKVHSIIMEWFPTTLKETEWIEEYLTLTAMTHRVMIEVWPFDEHYREYL
jgi:hypothetical protein